MVCKPSNRIGAKLFVLMAPGNRFPATPRERCPPSARARLAVTFRGDLIVAGEDRSNFDKEAAWDGGSCVRGDVMIPTAGGNLKTYAITGDGKPNWVELFGPMCLSQETGSHGTLNQIEPWR